MQNVESQRRVMSPAVLPTLLPMLLAALLVATLFSSQSYAAVPDRISGALTNGQTVALKGNVHHKALPQFDQGPVDPATRLGYVTLLTVPSASQRKALSQLVAQQQDRKSPNYRKWLTPEQWADRFGLSQSDIQKLTAWLKSQGFTVVNVAHGRNWIVFSGSAAQIQNTFGTEIHHYKVDGEMHVANASAPKIPAALSGIVTNLRGLNDFHLKPRAARSLKAAQGPRPAYYYNLFQPPVPPDFLAPGDIATIYDINALYTAGFDGTGQKLAVIGQTDVYLADISDFRAGFGLTPITGCTTNSSGIITSCPSTVTNFQYVVPTGLVDPGSPSPYGDITEADLDLEWSGAVARNAQIIYVNAPYNGTTGGVTEAWYYAIDNQATIGETVISLSYGICEFGDNFVLDSTGQPLSDEIELTKANSEGITFLNSTGDTGAAGCDAATNNNATTPPNLATGGLAVGYPASSPEVTGVGGSAVNWSNGFSSTYWGTVNGTDGGSALTAPIPETSWNDNEELVTAYPTAFSSAQVVQESYGISSSSGGPSNCAQQSADNSNCVSGFGQPSWQTVTMSGQTSARFTPDVSLMASPNFPGYIFYTPQNAWSSSTSTASTCATGIPGALSFTDPSSGNPAPSLVGGTSASTPVMAGIVILLNQYLGANGLGNINPTLYILASTPSNGAFHQVTTGDNNVYCEVGQPVAPWPTALQCPSTGVFGYSATVSDATTGYNLVTGLGSVDANNLAIAWAAAPSTTPDFTLSPLVSTLPITAGGTASAIVNVQLASSFAGTITFTCTGAPTAGTCTAPSSTTAAGQVTFTVTTTAPSSRLQPALDHGTRILYAALLPGLLGIVFMAGTRRRTPQGLRVLGMIVFLGCSMMWVTSCGGGSSSSGGGGGGGGNTGTPAGTYTVTITGTSGTSTATTYFQVVVQ
jgi:subtilase family serine protease